MLGGSQPQRVMSEHDVSCMWGPRADVPPAVQLCGGCRELPGLCDAARQPVLVPSTRGNRDHLHVDACMTSARQLWEAQLQGFALGRALHGQLSQDAAGVGPLLSNTRVARIAQACTTSACTGAVTIAGRMCQLYQPDPLFGLRIIAS